MFKRIAALENNSRLDRIRERLHLLESKAWQAPAAMAERAVDEAPLPKDVICQFTTCAACGGTKAKVDTLDGKIILKCAACGIVPPSGVPESLRPPPGPMVDMLLWCPGCGERHVDEGVFVDKAHHTHACQTCGMCWRPAVVATRGVLFLPGFKS